MSSAMSSEALAKEEAHNTEEDPSLFAPPTFNRLHIPVSIYSRFPEKQMFFPANSDFFQVFSFPRLHFQKINVLCLKQKCNRLYFMKGEGSCQNKNVLSTARLAASQVISNQFSAISAR